MIGLILVLFGCMQIISNIMVIVVIIIVIVIIDSIIVIITIIFSSLSSCSYHFHYLTTQCVYPASQEILIHDMPGIRTFEVRGSNKDLYHCSYKIANYQVARCCIIQ